MRIALKLAAATAAVAALCAATETKVWSLGDYSDFEKGSAKRLSLTSDGRLTLAPSFRELFDSASVYLWALAEDSKGNVYAGGGGPGGPGARVYVIPPSGKGKLLVQLDDLEIHALAVDSKDRVFAATSPDGKVYRISEGKAEPFFDPHAKYIWGMAFDSKGDLYVATGDRGEVYRVSPSGKGAVFYKSAETHARSLAVDRKDNLIVGTEPGGLIVRVSPKGDGFVLYQAPKREITAVAVAPDGAVWAAGVGAKQTPSAGGPIGPPPSMPAPQPAIPQAPGAAAQAPRPALAPAATGVTAAPAAIPGGSEVYKIGTDGFPRKAWTNAQNIVYTIAFDADGRPLLGTGNKGTIYRIDSDLVYSELVNAQPTQVTCIYTGRGGKMYAATGNVGKVYQIGPGFEKDGTLESEVFDAGLFSQWGRLSYRGQSNSGQIVFETRSGNLDRPEKDWSAWSVVTGAFDGGRVGSPPARFVQWRATLRTSSSGGSPEVNAVDVAYLPRNVAPQVTQIEVTPANYKFPAQATLTLSTPPNLNLPPLTSRAPRPAPSTPPVPPDAGGSSMQYAKGWIGVRWVAADENGDALNYTLQIKGENEAEWKPLKDKLTDRHFSWDSTAYPDGDYRLRVIASDAPGNPPDQALTGELVSDPFTIDNTPPQITGLAAAPSGASLTVRWRAVDALSVIDKAEMSVDGGEWTLVEPTTKLSDSRDETYEAQTPRPAGNEHTIAVRVSDEFDNQAVAKIVVH